MPATPTATGQSQELFDERLSVLCGAVGRKQQSDSTDRSLFNFLPRLLVCPSSRTGMARLPSIEYENDHEAQSLTSSLLQAHRQSFHFAISGSPSCSRCRCRSPLRDTWASGAALTFRTFPRAASVSAAKRSFPRATHDRICKPRTSGYAFSHMCDYRGFCPVAARWTLAMTLLTVSLPRHTFYPPWWLSG